MLRNYFIIALRNLKKHKSFSLINILGLAVGMACCMLLWLFVQHETSYDKHHTRANNMYRVGTEFVRSDNTTKMGYCAAPFAFTLKSEYPEIEQATRLYVPFSEDKSILQLIDNNTINKSFYETKGYLADSTFFDMFNYPFIEGNPTQALNKPNAVVLSEEIATKLFGTESALGRTLRISNGNGTIDFSITGVFKEAGKSHIDGRFFMSLYSGEMGDFVREAKNFAYNNMFYTYIKLAPNSNASVLQKKLPAFIEKYASADLKGINFTKNLFLEAVPDIHLYSEVDAFSGKKGSIDYVQMMSFIALFTLIIACINFMNLSTARSGKRATEVGIRKAIGAEKSLLIWQFLGESVLISLLALVVALVLVTLFIPLFNQLADTSVVFAIVENWSNLLWFLLFAIGTGILAGSYPAFYLSSFNPVRVLKGKFTTSLSVINFRKGLVVFQFAIATCLILATLVIWQQMQFMKDQHLGFTQEQQIVIPLRTENAKRIYATFRNEINRNPDIHSAAGSLSYPGINTPADQSFFKDGENMQVSKKLKMNYVDYDFMETLGFELVSGRFYSRQFPADTSNRLILNEKALAILGFTPSEAIGKRIHTDIRGQVYHYEIIGVIKDFHQLGLQQPIEGFGFLLNIEPSHNYMVARANTTQLQPVLSFLEKKWKSLNSNEPFEYSFLDQDFAQNYLAEQRMSRTTGYFTLMAILISCLGLYGLAAFTAEQKIKEIGIRKVLGASISGIVAMLSTDFLKLVLLANIIAVPIAWYTMRAWLDTFAYSTTLSPWIFLLVTAIALFIALLTISLQSVKAALANPVKSLRNE